MFSWIVVRIQSHIHQKKVSVMSYALVTSAIWSELPSLSTLKEQALLYVVLCMREYFAVSLKWRKRIEFGLSDSSLCCTCFPLCPWKSKPKVALWWVWVWYWRFFEGPYSKILWLKYSPQQFWNSYCVLWKCRSYLPCPNGYFYEVHTIDIESILIVHLGG